jgi:GT2 family glycosyltransferase
VIAIRDAHSLAEAYNRGLEASDGEIVIFSHDDIDILAADFSRRLLSHFESHDVLGVIGGTQVSGPSWSWSGHPHLRGWITHRSRDDGWYAAALVPQAVTGDAVLLDGVFIAARRAVLDDIKFDEETFDGFHCYDIDWSYRAWQSGYRIGVAGDLLLVHESRGSYDSNWARYADRFCQKFRLPDVPPPPAPFFVEERLQSEDEVKAFFGRLTELSWEKFGSETEENRPPS